MSKLKKMIAFVSAIALVFGVGSALAYKEWGNTQSHSNVLAKTFTSIDEIVKDSAVILKGEVSDEFRKEVVGEIVFHVYDVKVDTLYSNNTDQVITEGNTIEMYRLIGVDTNRGKNMVNIVAPEYQSLKQGEYLLFLNGQYDENLKKLILIPNTPNQLFRADTSNGFSSKNSNDIQFENITDTEALPSINEEELLKAIDSAK